jgi:hypothetical protein
MIGLGNVWTHGILIGLHKRGLGDTFPHFPFHQHHGSCIKSGTLFIEFICSKLADRKKTSEFKFEHFFQFIFQNIAQTEIQ